MAGKPKRQPQTCTMATDGSFNKQVVFDRTSDLGEIASPYEVQHSRLCFPRIQYALHSKHHYTVMPEIDTLLILQGVAPESHHRPPIGHGR
jgi:hypothetical protein